MLQQAAWGQQMSPNFGQMNSAQGVQSPQFGQPAMPWGQQMPFGLTSPTQPPQWGPTGQPPLWGQQSMTWRQPGSGAQSVGWEQLPTPQSGMITPPGHASQGAWGQATPFGNPLPMYSTAMAMGPVVSPLASPVQASTPNPWQTGVPSSQPAAHSTTSSFPAVSTGYQFKF
ncbi:protein transport protein Sec24-like CEF [Protopterus annectens]|uniref:protein transport protein Sec24-like CEF n=1 Tax=Protopterus annectens TaxID=7888 RepID=UPI001CFB7B7C|nr:protein transport protein Sec24-like CEF [Protopterus annectens]